VIFQCFKKGGLQVTRKGAYGFNKGINQRNNLLLRITITSSKTRNASGKTQLYHKSYHNENDKTRQWQ